MLRHRLLPLIAALVCLVLMLPCISGGEMCTMSEPAVYDEAITSDNNAEEAYLVIRDTQVGYPCEALQLTRQENNTAGQLTARQTTRRAHRFSCLRISLVDTCRERVAHGQFHILLTQRHAEGHYQYARKQLRC